MHKVDTWKLPSWHGLPAPLPNPFAHLLSCPRTDVQSPTRLGCPRGELPSTLSVHLGASQRPPRLTSPAGPFHQSANTRSGSSNVFPRSSGGGCNPWSVLEEVVQGKVAAGRPGCAKGRGRGPEHQVLLEKRLALRQGRGSRNGPLLTNQGYSIQEGKIQGN